jgi:hypothetical protein
LEEFSFSIPKKSSSTTVALDIFFVFSELNELGFGLKREGDI